MSTRTDSQASAGTGTTVSFGEHFAASDQFDAIFKEGMGLARFCDARLTEVQKSVEIVLKESGEEWKTAAFVEDAGEDGEDDDDRD